MTSLSESSGGSPGGVLAERGFAWDARGGGHWLRPADV